MKNIITNTLFAGISVMTLATGCVKETIPTDGATSDQIAESATALQALVNAIPVNMTYPYSAFGRTNNYGFDFGYPGMLCATDSATGRCNLHRRRRRFGLRLVLILAGGNHPRTDADRYTVLLEIAFRIHQGLQRRNPYRR